MRADQSWTAICLACLLLSCGPPPPPPPADADFIAFFEAHREVFSEIVTDPDGTALPDGPWGEIRRSVTRGRVDLAAWHRDIPGPGGCGKGFVHLTDPPADSVASLDGSGCPGNVTAYRPLGHGWYLYYLAND